MLRKEFSMEIRHPKINVELRAPARHRQHRKALGGERVGRIPKPKPQERKGRDHSQLMPQPGHECTLEASPALKARGTGFTTGQGPRNGASEVGKFKPAPDEQPHHKARNPRALPHLRPQLQREHPGCPVDQAEDPKACTPVPMAIRQPKQRGRTAPPEQHGNPHAKGEARHPPLPGR